MFRTGKLSILAIVPLLLLSGCAKDSPCSQANVNAALNNSKAPIVCASLLVDNKYIAFLQTNGAGFIQENDRFILAIPSDKLFEPNSADFSDGSETYLQALVKILEPYQTQEIDIFANTDPIAGEDFNNTLSHNQATQITGYLWSHGISNSKAHRVNFKGNGELKPIATNEKLAGMAKNRNVMIVVKPQKEKPILKAPTRQAPTYKKTYSKADK